MFVQDDGLNFKKGLTTNYTAVRVPTVAADLTTVNAEIKYMYLTNTTASSITVTIVDKGTTARYFLKTTPIVPYDVLVFEGVWYASGGINWVSSADGIDAQYDIRIVGG